MSVKSGGLEQLLKGFWTSVIRSFATEVAVAGRPLNRKPGPWDPPVTRIYVAGDRVVCDSTGPAGPSRSQTAARGDREV